MAGGASFRELQSLPRRRAAIALALPPCAMLAVLIWQVALGHPWGKQPMSNASIIGWTIFLWLLYLRLLTVRLSTQVRDGVLVVGLRGLILRRKVQLTDVSSVELTTFDAQRDYGGYGIRSIRDGKAYVAAANRGVRVRLRSGGVLVIGSGKPEQLAAALRT